MEDGSYQAAIYPFNVHHKGNGVLHDIDNTLKEASDENSQNILGNSKNDLKVKISQNINSNNLVKIKIFQHQLYQGFKVHRYKKLVPRPNFAPLIRLLYYHLKPASKKDISLL